MDINIIIKRGAAYILTSLFVIPIFGLSIYCTKFNTLLLLLSAIFLGLIFTFFGKSFQEFLITTAKRKFIKGYYDAEAVLGKIAKGLFQETQREKIFKKLEDILYAELEIENEAVIVAVRDNDKQLSHYQMMSKDTINTQRIEKGHPIIQYFSAQSNVKLLKEMDTVVIDGFVPRRFNPNSVLIPFSSPEILEGILILGERSGGVFYGAQDLAFFQNLIIHVSGILYRLTPLEVVEKNFAVTQKKIYDAQLAYKQSEKIASISTLIKRGAHSLKNPLMVATMTVKSLLDKERSPEYLKESHQNILKNLEAADKLIIDMLKINEPRERIEETVDVNAVLGRIINQFEYDQVKKYQHFTENAFIRADSEQIEEIFTNIITNSFDAIAEKHSENRVGEIRISTAIEVEKVDGRETEFVLIEIEDNGCGIKKEDLPRVFEAFYSTKSKGSGFGLSITYRFVRENYGEIVVDSEKGKWTKFSIKFPKH